MANLTLLGFEGICKTLELWTRKVIESCKQNLVGHSRSLETMEPRYIWTVEAQFKRFQRGTILATGPEAISVIFWGENVAAFCLCVKNLPKTI